MERPILETYDMERLILEAYDNAQSNDFFAITSMVEHLINRRYSRNNPRGDVTTGQIRHVLERRGMSYTLDHQQPVAETGYRVNRHRGRRILAVFK